jgi:hypothetical protein
MKKIDRETFLSVLKHFDGWRYNGFSFYKDVIIVWDEDTDNRIVLFLDSLDETQLDNLICVSEAEGGLTLIWARELENQSPYPQDVEISDPNNWGDDSWNIENVFLEKDFEMIKDREEKLIFQPLFNRLERVE